MSLGGKALGEERSSTSISPICSYFQLDRRFVINVCLPLASGGVQRVTKLAWLPAPGRAGHAPTCTLVHSSSERCCEDMDISRVNNS